MTKQGALALSRISPLVNSQRRGSPARVVPHRLNSSLTETAMFEHFTDKAIKAIMLAQEEARRLGHNFVGTEQILLGLIGEGTGVAKVLTELGVTPRRTHRGRKNYWSGSGLYQLKFHSPPR